MWVVQGLGSATFESLSNAASHSVRNRWPVEMIAWWQRLVAATAVAAFALCWRGAWPEIPTSRVFWIPAGVSIACNTVTAILQVRALRHDLSMTLPITALSPVFLLASEPLLTGRLVPMYGMLGVLVIGFGLYVLNLPVLRTRGAFGPFKNIWFEPGQRLMFIVVAIWAITAPLDKTAVATCDPIWYPVALHGGICLLLTPILFRKTSREGASVWRAWRLGSIGLLSGAGTLLQMLSFASAPTATYVIALRRFSAPLSSLWGWLYFKEPHMRERLLGTCIMTAGAAIIFLSL